MGSTGWQTALISVLLIGVGVLSWSFYLRAPLDLDVSSLERFPHAIGAWQGRDIPMTGSVEELLEADFNIQRVYTSAPGELVWFYLGYYGTDRGGHAEHTPWECYPSQGWEILEHEIVPLSSVDVGEANEIVVVKAGERRLVRFWYQSNRSRGMTGSVDQALDRIGGHLLEGRADGSLVRISTPILDALDIEAARARLVAFEAQVMPLLDTYWPREGDASES